MKSIGQEIIRCDVCPRLRRHCERVAIAKRKAFATDQYWGRPITGFGDANAEVLIVGLAPAAHGANRTGRIFTGDRSGDWLFRALHRAGFANQPTSRAADDGLELRNAYVTCVVRCAPPENKPSHAELRRCSRFLQREIETLERVRVFIALGQIALQGLWPLLVSKYQLSIARPRFAHGALITLTPGILLITSYHPSQQNTFTGRLTESRFDKIFEKTRTAGVSINSAR
ncbi:MAG TPA: uracil-DNA glycosylase [Bdellovibrionota bacterium]|nr:uracil-DNA glycosylase [Bdellovibrionota bacterium]